MRILLFTHRFGKEVVGGAEHHLWCLAEQMARMGCQVDVATTLQDELETDSLVVYFNAWREQRSGPPWWGMLSALRRAAVAGGVVNG